MSIVIVGASQGLGEALCEAFYQKGHQVVAASRNEQRLVALKERFPHLRTFTCDVMKEEDMPNLMKFAHSEFGGISCLLYNAGVNFDDVVADWEDTKLFEQVIQINLTGAVRALHAALPYLSASPRSQVVALTSLAGVFGCVPGGTAYAASKAGLDAFFCSASPELKALGIKVLIVDPGSMIAPSDSQRQVLGSGTRYRDAKNREKKGRTVEKVAQLICEAVEQQKSGRLWSTSRLAIWGVLFAKLFLPSLMERMALRVRFKNGGRLPEQLRARDDSRDA